MSRDRASWDELQNRWVAGEPLSTRDDEGRLALAEVDPSAGRELEMFAELHAHPGPASADRSPEVAALVDRVLAAAGLRAAGPRLRLVPPHGEAGRPSTAAGAVSASTASFRQPLPRHPVRPRLVAVVGATVSAAAAIVALAVGRPWNSAGETAAVPATPRPDSPPAPAVPSPAVTRCELVFASGQVFTGSQRAAVGGLLPVGHRLRTKKGRACVTVDPGIDVCFGEETEVRLRSLTAARTEIEVERGRAVAALATRAPGTAFALSAGGTTATARGTVFALERRPETASTTVVVLEGVVEVRGREGSPAEDVHAHTSLQVDAASGRTARAVVGRGEEGPLAALLAPRALWKGAPLGVIEIAAGSTGQEALVGRAGPLALPLRTFVAAGAHRILLQAPGAQATAVDVLVGAGRTHRVDPADAVGPPRPGPNPPATTVETPAVLLSRARRELERGNAAGAFAVYERMTETFPASSEASTVLVTMAHLALDRLHRPGKALALFNAYLRKGGGPLSAEASAGRIRALRALGHRAEERAAIHRYLVEHPSGFDAPALRRRLAAFGAP